MIWKSALVWLGALAIACAPQGVSPEVPEQAPATHPKKSAAETAAENSAKVGREKVAEQGGLGFDAMLTGYPYPYPVHFFETESQGHALKMAYMLLKPSAEPNKARTVTLLHGKNFSGAYWKSTAQALLDAGFSVLIPDQVGFGKSSKPIDLQYSFFELARLTRELWQELGIEETAAVGHSMGGMLATRLTLMAPETVSRLVLVNPIGLEDWKRKVPYHSVDQWTHQNEKATPDGIRQYMRTSYFDGRWKPEYDALAELQVGWILGPDSKTIARVSALHYDMIFTQPVVYEFSEIQAPTLLVIGQRDRTALGKNWVSKEVKATLGNYPVLGRKAHEAITNSKLIELDNVGHIPQVENYEAWKTALLDFLN